MAANGSSSSFNYKIVDVLHQVTSLLTARETDLKKKNEKLKVLKERKENVEGYLTEKDDKITRLEEAAHAMEMKLAEEKWRRERAQSTLAEKENKIKQLQDYVYQKDRELQEEKDDKQEKCGQLRDQLEQAQANLKLETAAKEKVEAELEEANKNFQNHQEDVVKAMDVVKTEKSERKNIVHVLEWTDEDLKAEIERERHLGTRYTILILLTIAFVLFGILVEVSRRCICAL